jgi:hypothetical protein
MDHGQADLQKKQQRVRLILNLVNSYFFGQVAIWAGFMLAYIRYEDRVSMFKVQTFDAANKFLPAILLILSVVLFRNQFNGKQ